MRVAQEAVINACSMAVQEAEQTCLIRATDGKKKVATTVSTCLRSCPEPPPACYPDACSWLRGGGGAAELERRKRVCAGGTGSKVLVPIYLPSLFAPEDVHLPIYSPTRGGAA